MQGTAPPDSYVDAFDRRGFALGDIIGCGLSGTVYRARQRSLERDVAIKVFDNPASLRSEQLRKRFKHEALLLARMQHPSLPVVLTHGEIAGIRDEPLLYTVLEFIDGSTLDAEVKKHGRIDAAIATRTILQVLSALSCAHAQHVVHRDVKPSNIILQENGHAYLIDFSIGVSLEKVPGLTRVTGDNNQPGTCQYMAPEQLAGHEVDHRADIYSAGVVLFEMLAGHERVRLSAIHTDLRDVTIVVRQAIERACQPEPADRFESADAFRRALARFESAPALASKNAVAICRNRRCPQAAWTERGYYEGPRIIEETQDSFCDGCGGELSYPCTQCGSPFNNTRYCGSCGASHYDVPECKQCGSWLQVKDIDADTAANGCAKCRSKRGRSIVVPVDDDIPF